MPGIASFLRLHAGLARLHTLPASAAPVLLVVVYAYLFSSACNLLHAFLCLVVALTAQICSNYANDLLDFRKGRDTARRKGFARPLSQGRVSEWVVWGGLLFWLFIMMAAGLWIIWHTHYVLLIVGACVAIGIFAYSGGPYPLSTHGLGDLAVLLFYGIVPVIFTYYAVTGQWADAMVWHMGVAVGLASVNILVVNNYRDYEEDAETGKQTTIVRFGRDFGPRLYLSCGLLSIVLFYPLFNLPSILLAMLYLSLVFLPVYRRLLREDGKALNAVLASTGRNVFWLSLMGILMMLIRHF